MRGISEKQLTEARNNIKLDWDTRRAIDIVLCSIPPSNLQEPWMTLEEFLKSGFEGACWIYTNTEFVYMAYYVKDGQFYGSDLMECRLDIITDVAQVMPIHKPESLR